MSRDIPAPIAATRPFDVRRLPLVVSLGVIVLVTYACHASWPLFSENQNTKFLYGLAKAGYGRLHNDWTVAQGSDLQIFDAFVYATQRVAGSWFFYAWHFGLICLYALLLYMVSRIAAFGVGVAGKDREPWWFIWVFGAWFMVLNTNQAALRALGGLANQQINGRVFETQSLGVLTLLGIVLFRLGSIGWSCVVIVAAAWIHPPYSIAGLMVLAGIGVSQWRFEGFRNVSFLELGAGAIGCLAAAAFAYSLLLPTDPAVQAEAFRILTYIRIPGHSWPNVWLREDAALKLAGLVLVIWLARRDPLGWLLGTVTVAIVASALWVEVTRDAALALAAPWRASAIIVPVAAAFLGGWMIRRVADLADDRPRLRKSMLALTLIVFVAGLGLGVRNRIDFVERTKLPVYFDWVRQNARDGDVFLTSPDESRFRLGTGQPQFVSWKTHPHRGEAVLEWYRRVGEARDIADAPQPDCTLVARAVSEGVSHIVRRAALPPLVCPGWTPVYRDAGVEIFRHS